MKNLRQHINEALKIGNNLSEWSAYSCQPKTNEELKEIIKDRISKEGPNCDLNDIDVSLITDMSKLFYEMDFNGDISKWNVTKVENMERMFYNSKFNEDISRWDVSNGEDFTGMFSECNNFNCDLSNWNVNKGIYFTHMFYDCSIKDEYKPKFK